MLTENEILGWIKRSAMLVCEPICHELQKMCVYVYCMYITSTGVRIQILIILILVCGDLSFWLLCKKINAFVSFYLYVKGMRTKQKKKKKKTPAFNWLCKNYSTNKRWWWYLQKLLYIKLLRRHSQNKTKDHAVH